MHDVPGGSFYRDYDGEYFMDMSAPATVSAFGLDVYEVTVGRFRKFVNLAADGGASWVPPMGAGKHAYLPAGGVNSGGDAGPSTESGWEPSWDTYLPTSVGAWNATLLLADCGGDAGPSSNTWTTAPGGQENLPVTCVNWYEAYAFCIWDGGFLPTAAEWDYAASGGANNQWAYAWGSKIPPDDSTYAIWGCWYGSPYAAISFADCVGTANVAPVGTAAQGQGLWGQFNLTGNVGEWVLDYWAVAPPLPCTDCANLTSGVLREIRGGAWDTGSYRQLASAYLLVTAPEAAHGDAGFRCARAPQLLP